ncbi:hypothetical protein [Arthrobacter sp. HLT1-21]
MSTIERAAEIVEEVSRALTAAGVEFALVTTDLAKVPAALANGPAVAVQPPKLKYLNHYIAEATWELYVIAGPSADRLAAWANIDPILSALHEPMSLDTAEPATFSHPGMPAYPAYVVSFTDSI